MADRVRDRGKRRGEQHVASLADELRRARLAAGLTQELVANAVGISRAELSRIERQRAPWLGIVTAAELAAVVGLDLWVKAYAGADPLRDAAHVDLLGRFLALAAAPLITRTEVPLPAVHDQRAWDATISDRRTVVGVEAETRLFDSQALERRIALKRRDGGLDRVILVIADTRSNRVALRLTRSRLRADYPLDTDEVVVALTSGRVPKAGGVVLL